MLDYDLMRELAPIILGGDTQTAVAKVSEAFRAVAESPYHRVLDLDFTNDPKDVATLFDRFVAEAKEEIDLGAIYTETNGFDINWDRWHFGPFAYEEHGGHEEFDWLAEWDTDGGYELEMTLTGMEELQEIYANNFGDRGDNRLEGEARKERSKARSLCTLLVVCKFQDLIRRSVPLMNEVDVPVLATGHGFDDFIAEIKPR